MPSNTSSKSKSKSKNKSKSSKGSVKLSNKDAKKLNKSSKNKFNRFANIERGDAPNKQTKLINGFFNVNIAKTYVKTYIRDVLELEINSKSIRFPFSATAETLIHNLVLTAAKYAKKDSEKANLYIITAYDLQRAIRENRGYGRAARQLVNDYDPTARNYIAGFYVSGKRLKEFVETKTTLNKNNVSVTKDALNFICYYAETILCDIIRTACNMAIAGKQCVSIKYFIAAAEDHLTGDVGAAVSKRLDEIKMIFSTKNNKEENKEEEDEEETNSQKNDKEDSEDEDEDNEDDTEEESEIGSDDESGEDSD